MYDVSRIVEGRTQPLRWQLQVASGPISLSGLTVTLDLVDRYGTALVTTATVTISDASNGIVIFTPPSSTFFVPARGPYFARWVLTDSLGEVSYVPEPANRDVWEILAR